MPRYYLSFCLLAILPQTQDRAFCNNSKHLSSTSSIPELSSSYMID